MSALMYSVGGVGQLWTFWLTRKLQTNNAELDPIGATYSGSINGIVTARFAFTNWTLSTSQLCTSGHNYIPTSHPEGALPLLFYIYKQIVHISSENEE